MSEILYLLDPKTLIAAFGLIGVITIVFAETGLFFGFFFPGDSLLFTAGFFASQGYLPIGLLFVGCFIAAVVGDSFGYTFGKKVGPAIFVKENSRFFDRRHIARAQHFYEKYGGKTIVLARFMPIIRTFAPIVAGVGGMEYRSFIAWNVMGGFLWTFLLISLGYGLGSVIPDPDKYVIPAVIVMIIVSAAPAIREILKKRDAE